MKPFSHRPHQTKADFDDSADNYFSHGSVGCRHWRSAELQSSLAVAVIGGLATSTFLTLYFVPVVYSLFDDLSGFRQRRKQRSSRSVGKPSPN